MARSSGAEKRSGGESRIAPAIAGSQPYFSARSVPNDQPTSQMLGSSANSAYSMAAATSYRSPTAPSKAPSLVPRTLLVPRVLNRSTARSASAGSRQAALRNTWLSIIPPWVGSGCRQTRVATGGRSAGRASSPTSRRPSAVCSSMSSRRPGRIDDARIAVLTAQVCREVAAAARPGANRVTQVASRARAPASRSRRAPAGSAQ